MWLRFLLIIVWVVITFKSSGQSLKPICYYAEENPDQNSSPILNSTPKAIDSADAVHQAWAIIDSFQSLGYFACYIKTFDQSDSCYSFTIHFGNLYYYDTIDLVDVPDEIKTNFKLNRFLTNYSVYNARRMLKKIADYLENEGFQYARVKLDSTLLDKNSMTSILKVDTGTKVVIDSVYFDGNHSLSPGLLKRILNLRSGEIYSKAKLDEIAKNVNALPFITITKAPVVSFFKNKAMIHFQVQEKKHSRIDALLGVLPSSPPKNQLKLNGTFNALLVNQFNAGESVAFNFQSLQNNSQQLKLEWSSPYLFNLPFSPVARFNMYRRDSLFQDIRADVGASWLLSRMGEFKANFGSLSSSLLKPDLNKIKQTKTLPAALDTRQTYATAGITFTNLKNGALSRTGFLVNTFITGYSRNIKKNVSIISLRDGSDTTFSFETLYEPFTKKGYAVELGVALDHYLKIKKYSVLFQSLRIHFKEASTQLQINEMYRLGGYSTLRGFDEESIFAVKYLVLKNEYRLMTGSRSYLFSHIDIASMKEFFNEKFKTSNFLSLGAGLAVDTSLGILSVASSVGRRYPTGFDFRVVKLHVGYVNYF